MRETKEQSVKKEAIKEQVKEAMMELGEGNDEGILSKENILVTLSKWQLEHIQRIENELIVLREEVKKCSDNLLNIPTRDDVSNNYCTRLWLFAKFKEGRAKLLQLLKLKK